MPRSTMTSVVVIGGHSVVLPAVDDVHAGPDVSAVVRQHEELHVHAVHCLPLVVSADL